MDDIVIKKCIRKRKVYNFCEFGLVILQFYCKQSLKTVVKVTGFSNYQIIRGNG